MSVTVNAGHGRAFAGDAAASHFARKAAASHCPVLLLGETGSGKTHLARVIHELSPRARHPFVRVDCGAIPETLFEGEMFGHVRGAYTDAREGREGLIEAAGGGTLFLDEIAEIPMHVQCKLLGVLEERRIRRLGDSRERAVDVRVIAATNADLEGLMRERRFRQDLYHRLAVLTFRVRPLRERRDEIPQLISTLLGALDEPAGPVSISDEALTALRAYSWPGNVRELNNALRRAAVFAEGPVIAPGDFPDEIRAAASGAPADGHDGQGGHDGRTGRYQAPDDARQEVTAIARALRAEGGNRTRAARRLGMSRAALWIKLQRYGMSGMSFDGEEQAGE